MKNFLQKKNAIIAAAAVAVLVIVILLIVNRGPHLRLEGFTEGRGSKIKISEINPVNINDSLLVPAKVVFEEAGFKVDWDEKRQSVKLTLETGDVKTPAQKKAAELLYKYKNTFPEKSVINAVIAYVPVNRCEIVVMYNYKDMEGKNINVEKTYVSPVSAKINEDNKAYVPLRAVAERFGLDVEWKESGNLRLFVPPVEDERAIEAMNTAKGTETPSVETEEIVDIEKPQITPNPNGEYTKGEYIGKFKITHYCLCTICNGSWGNQTAYGGAIRPGVTIAVDPSVIRKLAWVYIDGYGLRLAEDIGGAIRGYHIDMAMADHQEARDMGVTYRDVWYAEAPEE